VVVHYSVAAANRDDFLEAIGALRTSRLRTGATHWMLLRDAADPDRLVERYRVASWAEYLDQREHRQTPYDEEVRRRVEALATNVDSDRLITVALRRPAAHH